MHNELDGLVLASSDINLLFGSSLSDEIRRKTYPHRVTVMKLILKTCPYIRKNGFRALLAHIEETFTDMPYNPLVFNYYGVICLSIYDQYCTTHYRSGRCRDAVSCAFMDISAGVVLTSQEWQKFNE